jgi:ubiquinone/menaquinone biosynthesis C-methylase UbiE
LNVSAYPFNWSRLQSAEDMDVGRHFEYDQDAVEMFKRWLPTLQKGERVLEVGSGSGFFTGKLSQIYPQAEITCLEPDPELRLSLTKKHPDINVIDTPLEELTNWDDTFSLSVSHIVIHNLPDPVLAIRQMTRAVRQSGHVVCIEPVLGSRTIYPHDGVKDAVEIIWQYTVNLSIKRSELMDPHDRKNPFLSVYPEYFDEVGLTNIRSYGWCSVFTLSDTRFDYHERKMWIQKRTELYRSKRKLITQGLIESGMEKSKIDEAYKTLFEYFEMLGSASEEQLSHIHEQEVVSRTITIGQRA